MRKKQKKYISFIVKLISIIFFINLFFSHLIFSEQNTQNTPSQNTEQQNSEQLKKQQEEAKIKNELQNAYKTAFTLLNAGRAIEAITYIEKIIFTVKKPEIEYKEILEVFKPDYKFSLIPHLMKTAENYISKQQFRKALTIYKYLVTYNSSNPDIVSKYNNIYNKYKEILEAINRGIELERKSPIDARDEFKKAIELLNQDDKGELYRSLNNRLNVLQTALDTELLPNIIKETNELLQKKKFKEALEKAQIAVRIKNIEEHNSLVTKIKVTATNVRVAEFFDRAEKYYRDRKFDDAISALNDAIKEFKDNDSIIEQATQTIRRYELGKQSWTFRSAGLKYFDQQIWNRALANLLDYKRIITDEDKEVDEKIKIANEKIQSIANLNDFNVRYNRAVDLFNNKKFTEARDIFNYLRDNFPFNRNKVLEYINKINEVIDKETQIAQSLADADRLYRLGENRFNRVANDDKIPLQERIDSLNQSRLNFYSAKYLYQQIKRNDKVTQCDEMIERVDKRIVSIKSEENSRLRELVQGLLRRGKILFDQQNFTGAIETFNQVIEQIPDHPEAINYLKAAREAMLVKEETELNPTHRHYFYYITFKNRGENFFKTAETKSNSGKNITAEARNYYQKSLEQWRTILLWFPNNEEAHKYIRDIYRRTDPQSYEDFLKRYIELIKLYLSPPNVRKERAYHLLTMIQKEDRQFFNKYNLTPLLEQALPPRLNTALSAEQQNRIQAILQAANSAFASRDDNKTIALTRQAIDVNPFSSDPLMNSVRVLLTQAINRQKFGTETQTATAGPPPQNFQEATKYYYQAMAAYQARDYAKTIQLCRQALRILPTHTQAQQLLRIAEQRLS